MTNEMLIGGLMILGMGAGIVLAMTSSRRSGNGRFETDTKAANDRKT